MISFPYVRIRSIMRDPLENTHQSSAPEWVLNETIFRSLIVHMLDALLILDWNGTILFANQAAADLVQLASPELGTGMNALDFIHPASIEDVLKDQQQVFEDRGGFLNRYKILTVNKEVRWAEGLGTKIPFQDGTANLVTLRDITQKQQIEEALLESREKTQAIIANIVDGIITINEQGVIDLFNHGAEQIFDYTAEEVAGQCVTMLMPEPFRSEHASYLKRYLETGEKQVIGIGREGLGQRKDGTVFPIYLSVGEIHLPGGRRFVGVIRDISNIKKTEAILKDREQQFRELTILQKAILDSANHSIISTAPDGIIQTFNKAAQRWLGYTEEDVVKRSSISILHAPQEVAAYAEELTKKLGYLLQPGFEVFAAKARQGIPDEREWTYIRKDGSTFPVLLSITALLDELGDITGYLAIGSDITERKKADEALRKLSWALEQSPASVVITDTEGAIEYVNPKFYATNRL